MTTAQSIFAVVTWCALVYLTTTIVILTLRQYGVISGRRK